MEYDKLIELARVAGFLTTPGTGGKMAVQAEYPVITDCLKRFAALVAADERAACAREVEGYPECAEGIRARTFKVKG